MTNISYHPAHYTRRRPRYTEILEHFRLIFPYTFCSFQGSDLQPLALKAIVPTTICLFGDIDVIESSPPLVILLHKSERRSAAKSTPALGEAKQSMHLFIRMAAMFLMH